MGAGAINTVGELAARLLAQDAQAPARDVACVVGKRDGEGWKVCLMVNGAPVMLAPEVARELGRDMLDTADICQGKWGV